MLESTQYRTIASVTITGQPVATFARAAETSERIDTVLRTLTNLCTLVDI